MKKINVENLEVGKDYINVNDLNTIVIDRCGDYSNKGFYGVYYQSSISCFYLPKTWRQATEEEVIEAFEKHLNHRFGEDWKTMKINEKHPDLPSSIVINDGLWNVKISKEYDGWNVWNRNGLLYCNGIWVERLEEPKIHIKEAIKVNTVIHCETEEEAERILGIAHKLGRKWVDDEYYIGNTRWEFEKSKTCYQLIDGTYSNYDYFKNGIYNIIPSTQIADLEEKKTTDWTPAPADIEAMNKKASEKLPIDKVTTRNLDIALRMVGIQSDINIIDKVIDLVELIENKGDDVTIKDIVSLQQTWKRHSQAFKGD